MYDFPSSTPQAVNCFPPSTPQQFEQIITFEQVSGNRHACVISSYSVYLQLEGIYLLTRLPIKHLVRRQMPLEQFIAVMLEQAHLEELLRLALKAQWRKGEWDPTP